jgi:hypothetical protein
MTEFWLGLAFAALGIIFFRIALSGHRRNVALRTAGLCIGCGNQVEDTPAGEAPVALTRKNDTCQACQLDMIAW